MRPGEPVGSCSRARPEAPRYGTGLSATTGGCPRAAGIYAEILVPGEELIARGARGPPVLSPLRL